jgi:hypothetical protein
MRKLDKFTGISRRWGHRLRPDEPRWLPADGNSPEGNRAGERIAGIAQHRVVRPAGGGESATARAAPLHLAIRSQRIDDGTHRATGSRLQHNDSVAAARPIQQGEVLAGVVGHDIGPRRQSCDQGPTISVTESDAGPPVLVSLPR